MTKAALLAAKVAGITDERWSAPWLSPFEEALLVRSPVKTATGVFMTIRPTDDVLAAVLEVAGEHGFELDDPLGAVSFEFSGHGWLWLRTIIGAAPLTTSVIQ